MGARGGGPSCRGERDDAPPAALPYTGSMVEQDAQATNAAGGNAPDPRTLTFSQAQGYESLPQPLALGEISLEARIKIWDRIHLGTISYDDSISYSWNDILKKLHGDYFKRPIDEYNSHYQSEFLEEIKALILKETTPFNEVFDLVQMIMRYRSIGNFNRAMHDIFRQCRLAYTIDHKHPVTILPAATEQEGRALLSAMNELRSAGLDGAAEHLRKAGEAINRGDWADSIRESIHAVESVARKIAPGTPQALGKALNSLEKQGMIPSLLKSALDKLNGYANQPGIRHAVQDNEKAEAGQDEAVFMLGACASFASYLWRKHQLGSGT